MKWHDYRPMWPAIERAVNFARTRAGVPKLRRVDRRTIYEQGHDALARAGDVYGAAHSNFEVNWRSARRPYYACYPRIAKALSTISLDFAVDLLIDQATYMPDILVRFSDDSCMWPISGRSVRTLWISSRSIASDDAIELIDAMASERGEAPVAHKHKGANVRAMSLSIGADYGELYEWFPGVEMPTNNVLRQPLFSTGLPGDRSVEEQFKYVQAWQAPATWNSRVGVNGEGNRALGNGIVPESLPYDMLQGILRFAVAIRLLASDPCSELTERVVLSKDAHRVADATPEELKRLVNRAMKRGVNGWTIGAAMEDDRSVAPHMRRPHPALMWTGKGRTTPRIVMRRGSVVHRAALTAVPTGYLDDGGDE